MIVEACIDAIFIFRDARSSDSTERERAISLFVCSGRCDEFSRVRRLLVLVPSIVRSR